MRQRFPIGDSITIEQLSGDPYPLLARLQSHEPVSWLPALDGWLVTGRDHVVAVMRDAATFTVDDPRFSTARVIGPSMLSLDGSEHRRHRDPFGDPFRAPAIRDNMFAWVNQRAGELVAGIAPAGRADLRASVAAPLAVDVMMRTLDLDGVDASDVLAWYEGIVAAVHTVTEGHPLPETGTAAFDSLHAAVSTRLTGSSLLAAVLDHGGLSVDEIVSNVAVLLFGGVVTSESTTAIVIHYLLNDEQARAEVVADRSLIAGAVEEALRLEPSAAVVDRYATTSVVLGGASIEAGDLVRVSLTAANRDPATFPDPDLFDIHRPNASQHVTFARGPHACLGIHLARLEAVAAVGAVLDHLGDVRLDPAGGSPVEGLVFRAPPSVHSVWRPPA